MNNKTKIGLLIAVGLGLMVLLYVLSPEVEKKEKPVEKEKPTKELFGQKLNKNGLYIFYELLKTHPNVASLKTIEDPIDSTLIANVDSLPSIYMLIDEEIQISRTAIKGIMKFVEEGNHAFVSLDDFSNEFKYEFTFGKLLETYEEEVMSIALTHDSLKYITSYPLQKFKNDRATNHQWGYFDLDNLRRSKNDVAILGYETYYEHPIFIKIPHGRGYFYLHSVPEMFMNESMFNEKGLEYAQRSLSSLPKGNYKWHSHLNYWDKKNDINNFPEEGIVRESPIQYILKDQNLRYAYLLLLFSLFAYVIFGLKRKQKIIPTVEPNNNTSLEFVETVSRLYLKQNKHYKFIKHYEQSFIHFIKDKYYISSPKIDKEYIAAVALKSDIEEEKILQIFKRFERAKKSYDFSSDQLIVLHKKIEYFYKNCN
ncbi:MAG: hypothetical protein P8N07_01135 [Flavobacteriales bacterium]|nr:hypothetical protein [Flavobacteriales bacterium]